MGATISNVVLTTIENVYKDSRFIKIPLYLLTHKIYIARIRIPDISHHTLYISYTILLYVTTKFQCSIDWNTSIAKEEEIKMNVSLNVT